MTPPDFTQPRIDLSHGAGGRATARLIDELFRRYLDNDGLRQQNDQAVLPAPSGRLALSTDAHVISPLFFPGGDIGALAVHGTLNDVAMAGARPWYLTAAFILEEGLPLPDLERIVQGMAAAAHAAGVPVVSGDTKVVERGKGDGCFIVTTGVGAVPDGINLAGDRARPGDRILISGTLGDHGIAVLSRREHLGFDTDLVSDSAYLYPLVAAMLAVVPEIRCLRDPTRGGLATTLNELAQQSGVGMRLQASALPVRPAVRAACELLGLDPLYVANEGKLVAICPPERADTLLATMREHPLARDAALIGTVTADPRRFVTLETEFGGERLLDWLAGEQLPRIC